MSIFIITGPSGVGKTTVSDELINRCPFLRKVVTTTTRTMREGEIDGVHYHFISPEKFFRNAHHGEFIEYSKVYNNTYGTSYQAIKEAEVGGRHALLVTDVQGAEWWKDHYPEDVVTIFILPPSPGELAYRLAARGTAAEEILIRAGQAFKETEDHAYKADYTIPNITWEDTVRSVMRCIESKI